MGSSLAENSENKIAEDIMVEKDFIEIPGWSFKNTPSVSDYRWLSLFSSVAWAFCYNASLFLNLRAQGLNEEHLKYVRKALDEMEENYLKQPMWKHIYTK